MAKRIPAAASDCDGMIGVIYARYSSHSQREESIEDQLRECHEFAARNNIKIIAEYTDSALTGRTDSRPDFQKMIRDSARGKFQVVVTYKVDRFARDRYDSAIYKAKLRKNGVRVLYAKRRYRTDLRASSWSQFSRDMPSITARRFPRTSSEGWKAMP